MQGLDKILKTAEKYSYISVDIYDTIVFRAVRQPNDIFLIVEDELNKSGEKSGFYKKRIAAEKKARKEATKEDVTIDEIYQQMNITDQEKLRYRTIEEKLELDFSIINCKLVDTINKIKRNGHKIIITTDMYLTRTFIEELLHKAELEYDYIFISGEIGLTKATGNIYPYILNALELSKTDLLHIGNDLIKDINNAKKHGIESIHINDRINETARYLGLNNKQKIKLDITSFFIYHSSEKKPNFLESVGYCCLGPFLVGFCNWIHNNFPDTNIWFVAREGYLIKKIYETLYPEEVDRCKYVRLNKNVLRKPMMYCSHSINDFLSTLPEKKELSIKDVLDNLHINISEVESIINQSQISVFKSYTTENIINDEEFMKLFDKIIKFVECDLEEQADLFKEYVSVNIMEDKNILFANNSIHGNGQYLLEKLFKEFKFDYCVTGIQFVKSKRCDKKEIVCKGWLKDCGISPLYQYIFDRNSIVFEHFLFENQGTAVQFCKEDGNVEVVCKKRAMESENDDFICSIQDAVIRFAQNYKKSSIKPFIDNNMLAYPFLRFLKNPISNDVSIVSGIVDDDDVNGSEHLLKKEDVKSIRRITLSDLKKTNWKQGYLKLYGTPDFVINIISHLLFFKAVKDGYYPFVNGDLN